MKFKREQRGGCVEARKRRTLSKTPSFLLLIESDERREVPKEAKLKTLNYTRKPSQNACLKGRIHGLFPQILNLDLRPLSHYFATKLCPRRRLVTVWTSGRLAIEFAP
eukprot:jgi/Bigna1/146206/aug1.110_g20914